jgi:hypothetical protein
MEPSENTRQQSAMWYVVVVLSDLVNLEVQIPRPDELCARYARRMDPWGFVIAAGLFLLGGLIVPILGLVLLGPRLDIVEGSLAAQVISLGGMVLGGLLAWKVFVRWRTGRLAVKRELIRSGKLVEMAFERELTSLRNSRKYSRCIRPCGDGTAPASTCGSRRSRGRRSSCCIRRCPCSRSMRAAGSTMARRCSR